MEDLQCYPPTFSQSTDDTHYNMVSVGPIEMRGRSERRQSDYPEDEDDYEQDHRHREDYYSHDQKLDEYKMNGTSNYGRNQYQRDSYRDKYERS